MTVAQLCRRCYQWKRRSETHGTCWLPEHKGALRQPDDTCAAFTPKVIHVPTHARSTSGDQ